jgi:ubiquinone/menaquinone biosynthesis C-methylase UbiE
MANFDRDRLIDIYRKRARNYDLYAKLFPLVGFRQWTYREKAVQALHLQRGDTVVDIGCGTGLNFPLLQAAIGPEGAIIGVDLTDTMLAQARKRVQDKGWSNVELVQSDAAEFRFPTGVDGIISTYAITLVPEFDRVIRNGCRALKPGKRWAIADFKMPSNALSPLAPLLALVLVRPFGGSIDLSSRHPWESIGRYMQNTHMQDFYMGFVYVIVGERGESGCG